MARRSAALAVVGAVISAALLGCAERTTAAKTPEPPPEPVVVSYVDSITASTVRARIAALSDDSMRGRFTPGAELNKAAAWAVSEFQRFGLGPGPATGFLQTVDYAGVGSAPNVIGVLEGRDSVLKSEYVVVLAHLDHLGVAGQGWCSLAGADSICNGADDNASGSAAVLELARAFAASSPRPRRSMLFLLVSGEERGEWGSQYYVAHPAVPIAQTVAAINLDMVGRSLGDGVMGIGRERSSLGPLADSVAASHPELHMRVIPDTMPQENLFARSDQYSFARVGVPALCFFTGLHADYHRPSDTVEKIEAEREARIVRLVYYLALQVANGAARPAVRQATAPARGPVAPP